MWRQGGMSSPTLLHAGVHQFPAVLLPEHTEDALAAQSGAFLLSSPSAGAACGSHLTVHAGYVGCGDPITAQPQGPGTVHASTVHTMQQLP